MIHCKVAALARRVLDARSHLLTCMCASLQMEEMCDPGCGHHVPNFSESRKYILKLMRTVRSDVTLGL